MCPCAHGAVVEQRQPVLDRRQPVRDLREVAEPELLLLFEVERAVVGRDALQRALAQRLVEHAPGCAPRAAAASRRTWRPRSPAGRGRRRSGRGTGCRSRRRSAGRGRAPRWISRTASSQVTCTTNSGRLVHSASRIARPVASPSTSGGRDQAWYLGSVLPAAMRLLLVAHDGVAVLAVDHHEAAGLAGLLEHGQELLVVDHQRALVGHEDLEGRDALGDAVAPSRRSTLGCASVIAMWKP